ncbi:CHC2-type zinc finger protein [Mucilaginibacter gracilis]|uniref:CHC2-type zinc finger protein n=1 Tax=Mucilaginibacter gracilis TaxID=423350 RepID=A0A495IYY4_9SPHI|nr:CHC2 zinc finger domain-containing protein [Mucilaginibacter gracilis]RKR81897.1 CHC2-type zinc finger protein [Mucilaginibacter gracilis]
MIPAEFIASVQSKTDLVELVSEFSELTLVGKQFVGPCPLHGGTGDTFTVSIEKQIYKCFKCGQGGNAIRFMVAYKKLSFPDAVIFLAKRLKMDIPDFEGQ